jgi:hypothetical protein
MFSKSIWPPIYRGLFIFRHYRPYIKKGASDGYRRPVLTSETTKRKKLSNMLLYNNLIGTGVQWMMDTDWILYSEGDTLLHAAQWP